MGSWNGTCGVSNLTIEEGQRAVMIPLVVAGKRVAGGATDEPDAYAEPIGLHMRGEYDSYGSLGLDDDSFAEKAFLGWLEAKCENRELVINNDFPDEMPEMWEFYQALERGEAALANPSTGARLRLGFMLVKEEIFDALVHAAGNEEMSSYRDNNGDWVDCQIARKDYLRALCAVTPEVQAQMDELAKSGKDAATVDQISAFLHFPAAQEYLGRVAPFAVEHFPAARRDKKVLRALNSFVLFRYGFENLRKNWLIPYGRLGADLGETIHLYEAVTRTTLAIIEAEKAEMDE